MKTYFIISVLIFGLSATNHGKPINDIYSIKEPTIEEEAYVDDIPFNTWDIASDIINEGDEVKMEEEDYVNDIPFSTEEFLCEYLAAKMREQYRNEANINDMPEELNHVIKLLQNGNKTSYTIIYPANSVLPKSIRIESEADHKVMIIPNASL